MSELSAELLATGRLTLTPLVEADAEAMVAVLSNERMYEFTGGHPPTLAELQRRYRALAVGHSADGTELWCNWIVRAALGPVGVVQATVAADRTTADVAWEIGVPWQGHGFASESARAVVEWLARSGVSTIRALVHPEHRASMRVAERAGLAITDQLVDGERVWLLEPSTT